MNVLTERVVDCPRCFQQCGWCSDYRWMHGSLRLPGYNKKCSMEGMEPEGDGCEVCGGTRKVIARTECLTKVQIQQREARLAQRIARRTLSTGGRHG